METVVAILIIIAALALIVTVLLQSGTDTGLGAAYGQGGDTYLSRSKAKTFEAKLALGTKITAAAFVVLCLIMLLF